MQGEDNKGGFDPHPGDPWHPSWVTDTETDDEPEIVVDLTDQAALVAPEEILEEAVAHFTAPADSGVINIEPATAPEAVPFGPVIPLREDASGSLEMLREFVADLNATSEGRLVHATAEELARFAAELELARSSEVRTEMTEWAKARRDAAAASNATEVRDELLRVATIAETLRLEQARRDAAASVRVWSEWEEFRQSAIGSLEQNRAASQVEVVRAAATHADLDAWAGGMGRRVAMAEARLRVAELARVEIAAERGRLGEAEQAMAAALKDWGEQERERWATAASLELGRAASQVEVVWAAATHADLDAWAGGMGRRVATAEARLRTAEFVRVETAAERGRLGEAEQAMAAALKDWGEQERERWATAASLELGRAASQVEVVWAAATHADLDAWAGGMGRRVATAEARLRTAEFVRVETAAERGRLGEAEQAALAAVQVWGEWDLFRDRVMADAEYTRAAAAVEFARSLAVGHDLRSWTAVQHARAEPAHIETGRAHAAIATSADAEIAAWVGPMVATLEQADDLATWASAASERARSNGQIERAAAGEIAAKLAGYARGANLRLAATTADGAIEFERLSAQLSDAAAVHAGHLATAEAERRAVDAQAEAAAAVRAESVRMERQLEAAKGDAVAGWMWHETQALVAEQLVADGVERNRIWRRLERATAISAANDPELRSSAIHARLSADVTTASQRADADFDAALTHRLHEMELEIAAERDGLGLLATVETPVFAVEVQESSRPWWKRIVPRRRHQAVAPITGDDGASHDPVTPSAPVEEPPYVERDIHDDAEDSDAAEDPDAAEEWSLDAGAAAGPTAPEVDTGAGAEGDLQPAFADVGDEEVDGDRHLSDLAALAGATMADSSADDDERIPDAPDSLDEPDPVDELDREDGLDPEDADQPAADASQGESTLEPEAATEVDPDDLTPLGGADADDSEEVIDSPDDDAEGEVGGDEPADAPEPAADAEDLLDELEEWTDPGWGLASADEIDDEDLPDEEGQIEFDWDAATADDLPDFATFTSDGYGQASTQEYAGLAEAVARAATEEHELSPVAAEIPGVESGMIDLDDVVAATGGDVEATVTPRRSDLALRIATGLGLLALFIASLAFQWSLGLLVFVVLMVAATEFYLALIQGRFHPLTLFGLAGTGGALIGTWLWGPVALPVALMLSIFAVVLFYALVPRIAPLVNTAVTLMVLMWIGGLGAFAFLIIDSNDYQWLLGSVVVTVAVMDVGQYFVGRRFGRHALAPTVSPKKTVEGLLGGIVVAVGAGYLWGFAPPLDHGVGVLLGLAIASVAPFGDLGVSVAKRALGVKDMGTILPGHGGVLDRIDAMLVALPVAWLVFTWAGLL